MLKLKILEEELDEKKALFTAAAHESPGDLKKFQTPWAQQLVHSSLPAWKSPAADSVGSFMEFLNVPQITQFLMLQWLNSRE